MSLAEALIQVYESNPRLEAARARLRAFDEGVPRALAADRPSISAQTSAIYSQLENNRGAYSLSTLRQALDLRQSLYSGGENEALARRADNQVLAERARLFAAEQDVLLEGIAVYTAVGRDTEVLTLALQNERILQQQLESSKQRFRFGEVSRTDVAQAETRYAGAIANRIRAEGDLALAASEFERVVGIPPEDLLAVGQASGLPARRDDALALVDTHPSVIAARFDTDTARDEVDLAYSAMKPKVTLQGQFGYVDEPSATLSWQRDASIGATLTVPLYQGGGEYARVRQSKQQQQQRRYELEDVRRGVARDISASWRSLETAQARLKSLDAQTRAAGLALEGVRQEALTGVRTVLDILDAEEELFRARVERERGGRDEVLSSYAVLASIGRLSVEELSLLVRPYDAKAYFNEVRSKWFGVDVPVTEGRSP